MCPIPILHNNLKPGLSMLVVRTVRAKISRTRLRLCCWSTQLSHNAIWKGAVPLKATRSPNKQHIGLISGYLILSFHLMLLYTSTPQQFTGKYCIFYTTFLLTTLFIIVTLQIYCIY